MDPTEQAQLGRSGVWVSRLGLGMAALGDAARISDDDAIAVIAATRSLGLRHVDTAAEYGLGLAERRLGEALTALGPDGTVFSTKVGRLVRPASRSYRLRHTLVESVSSRKGLRVLGRKARSVGDRLVGSVGSAAGRGPATATTTATTTAAPPRPPPSDGKTNLSSEPAAICDFSYDGMLRSFDESLVRLGTDRVDILFTHEPDLHERQAATSGYRALERLRSEGRAAAIGVAINDPEALVRFADRGDYDCFLLGGRYTLLEQQALDRLLPLARSRGIAILLGGPFNSGILADPERLALYDHAPAGREKLERARRIAAICDRHGSSIKAAALQFPLGHPAIASVLVGAASVAELEEDVALMHQPIPAGLWDELRATGLLRADAPVPTVP